MAIRKSVSRVTDRNRIRSLYSQGYSIAQIAAATSITDEHVAWLVKKLELPMPQGMVDREALKAELMAEIRAEMGLVSDKTPPTIAQENEADFVPIEEVPVDPDSDMDAIMEADLAARAPDVGDIADAETDAQDEAKVEKEAPAKKARPRRKRAKSA